MFEVSNELAEDPTLVGVGPPRNSRCITAAVSTSDQER